MNPRKLTRGERIKEMLDHSNHLNESSHNTIKVGSKVHLGFGTKGGAGFDGTVVKIDGDKVRVRSPHKDKYGPKEYEGPMKNVTLLGEAVNEESVDTFSTGQDTFAGFPVFTVSGQEYSNCIDGRKKNERWHKRLNMKNETNSAIRSYSHKNPGKPIVIRNEDTGEMIFLRRHPK